jgi:hypothetical protein
MPLNAAVAHESRQRTSQPVGVCWQISCMGWEVAWPSGAKSLFERSHLNERVRGGWSEEWRHTDEGVVTTTEIVVEEAERAFYQSALHLGLDVDRVNAPVVGVVDWKIANGKLFPEFVQFSLQVDMNRPCPDSS